MRKYDGNDVIRALRAELGLSQKLFAEHTELAPPYVSHLETGVNQLGATAALKIWDLNGPDLARLGFTFLDLVRGERR